MKFVDLAAEDCSYPGKRKNAQVTIKKDRGSAILSPPANPHGMSRNERWYPGMWYDPMLAKFDITAPLIGEGCVEDYQYLVGTTHYDDEVGLLCVTQKVYVGSSPVGKVMLVSRAPVLRNGVVSSRADSSPAHVADIVRMTGKALLAEKNEPQRDEDMTGKVN